jgi:hypothetical protein
MLILVSTCFLLLNAPSHICTIGLKIYTLKQSQPSRHTNATYLNSMAPLNETLSRLNNIELNYMTTSTQIESKSNINVKLYQLFYIIVIISHHISYLSYSINFFLYSFCGMKFRRELMRYLSKRYTKYHQQRQTSHIISGQHST